MKENKCFWEMTYFIQPRAIPFFLYLDIDQSKYKLHINKIIILQTFSFMFVLSGIHLETIALITFNISVVYNYQYSLQLTAF